MRKKRNADMGNFVNENEDVEPDPVSKRLSTDEIQLPMREVRRGRTAYLHRNRKTKTKQSMKHAAVVEVQTGSSEESVKDLRDYVARCAEEAEEAKTALIKCQEKILAIKAIQTIRTTKKQLVDNSNLYEQTLESLKPRNLRKCDKDHLLKKIESIQADIDHKNSEIELANKRAGKSDALDVLLEKSDKGLTSLCCEEKAVEERLFKQASKPTLCLKGSSDHARHEIGEVADLRDLMES